MKHIKLFEEIRTIRHKWGPLTPDTILYHGTDVEITKFWFPLWVTPDIGKAAHFSLHPSGGRKGMVEKGYIYCLKYTGNDIEKWKNDKNDRTYIIHSGDIQIIDIKNTVPDPITVVRILK